MSCLKQGTYHVVSPTSVSQVDIQVYEPFGDFFGVMIDNSKIRYSEIYLDGLGMDTDVISAVLPLYVEVSTGVQNIAGVFALDLVLSEINDDSAITNDAITAYLGEQLECNAYEGYQTGLDYVRGTEVCNPLTEINYGSGKLLPTENSKPGFEALGSLLYIFLFCVVVGLPQHKKMWMMGGVSGLSVIAAVLYIIFGIMLLVLIFVTHWHDIVVATDYQLTNMTVLETNMDPYRCCDIDSCSCSNDFTSASCDYNLRELIEDSCGNGYYCCQTRCQECNC